MSKYTAYYDFEINFFRDGKDLYSNATLLLSCNGIKEQFDAHNLAGNLQTFSQEVLDIDNLTVEGIGSEYFGYIDGEGEDHELIGYSIFDYFTEGEIRDMILRGKGFDSLNWKEE